MSAYENFSQAKYIAGEFDKVARCIGSFTILSSVFNSLNFFESNQSIGGFKSLPIKCMIKELRKKTDIDREIGTADNHKWATKIRSCLPTYSNN